jgi:fatty acid desaturase
MADKATSVTPKEKNPYQPRINSIRKVIYAEEKRLRAKYPILDHQNTLGMAWFLGCLAAMSLTSYFFLAGSLAWYFAIPLMAFYVSILHELEHDLIHELYFKESKWMQNLMFAFIWVAKVNANPWWRKPLHLKHHKTSGQVDDIEERLIGLGYPLGILRFLITITPLASFLVLRDVSNDSAKKNSLPNVNFVHTSIVILPVLLPGNLCLLALLFPSFVSPTLYNIAYAVCMLLYFPNTLRQASLQWVSTGCHYYGDIPEKNVFFQNQVLNHWMFYPLQAFCFNFGATHIIHHYVTRQPFYLRQMAADGVMDEFRKQGVRFNDLDIYKRAHRWSMGNENTPQLAVGA